MVEIPEKMIAIGIRQPGGPDVLEPETRPVPWPDPGEVLVKVAAAGVNRPDVFQRLGHYPPPKGASDIPGLEVAGTIVHVGRDTPRWSVGDQVTALVSGGGYAEYCVVNGGHALPVPRELDMVSAAGLPETTLTVWHNVFERGRLAADETLLVHGGTSGIGTTAIQLAKARGAIVIATAGSDEKCQAALNLGADHAVNYLAEDFVAVVKDVTERKGADVILDMVGGDYIERNYAAAAIEGRIVQIAFLNGSSAEVDFMRLMMKRLTHTGSTLRARSVGFKHNLAASVEQAVWPMIAAGDYRPVIDTTYPLVKAALAHERMEGSGHIGKIILTTAA